MGGTEFVASVSPSSPKSRTNRTDCLSKLFEECNSSSSSSLCVNHPHELATVIWEVFMALIIKGCLTIITFGIKVPGSCLLKSAKIALR